MKVSKKVKLNYMILNELKKSIESGLYDEIDWFNLDDEVEHKFPNLNEDEILKTIYYLETRFAKLNKTVTTDDKDIVTFKVLQKLLDSDLPKISRSDLLNQEYLIDSNNDSGVNNATKQLELFNVVEKSNNKLENNKAFYSVNIKYWQEKARYDIQDYVLLSELSPIMSSYINGGFVNTFNIQNLFHKFSNIIEFAIRPSVSHNKQAELEYYILEVLTNIETYGIDFTYITRTVKLIHTNSNTNKDNRIEVIPIKIIFKGGEKHLLCRNLIDKAELTIPFYELSMKKEILPDDIFTKMQSNFTNYMMSGIDPTIQDDEIQVILECDSVVYEYFQMKPLLNMQIFDDGVKLDELKSEYKIHIKNNKFYVIAKDNEEKIISTVMHVLDYLKVLSPKFINEAIVKKLERFKKSSNINVGSNKKPINAYEPWSEESDTELINRFHEGMTVPELAHLFGRTVNSISKRLKKLGIH